jgi:lysophospholipid acyltransferase (LPLAT)-like uncharacterized protein
VTPSMAAAAGRAMSALYRVCFATWRITGLLPDGTTIAPFDYRFGREIFALSERDAIALAGLTAAHEFAVLVANGRDGDWAAAMLAGLGCRVARGATRRGGMEALIDLLRLFEEAPTPAGIVADGPLGPVGHAKPGVLWCAARTGRPARAIGAAAARALVFRGSWSGLYIPLPFTRVVVACEAPLCLQADASREDIDRATAELDRCLDRARQRALDGLNAGLRATPRAPRNSGGA